MSRVFVSGIASFALLLCAGLSFDADQAQAGHHRRGCGGASAGACGGGGGLFGRHKQRGRQDCCGTPVCCEPAPVCCQPAPVQNCGGCGQVSQNCGGCGGQSYGAQSYGAQGCGGQSYGGQVYGGNAGCANCSNTMDSGAINVESSSPSNAPVMNAPGQYHQQQGQYNQQQGQYQGQPQAGYQQNGQGQGAGVQAGANVQTQGAAPDAPNAPAAPAAPATPEAPKT